MSNAKPPKTLDFDQQLLLLKQLQREGARPKTRRKGVRNYLMALLMLDAGLRVGEVVQLNISHLFFNHVPVKTLVLCPSITKNHKERTVPVSYRLTMAMQEYYNAWCLCMSPSDGSFCFYVTRPTVAMSTRQVENIINTAAMDCLGRPVNPHMLRHTFASRLLRVANMRTVQEMLGHNCITSTQIYTHPNEDDKKEAIEKVETAAHDYMSDRFGPSGA